MNKLTAVCVALSVVIAIVWAVSFGQFQATEIYDNGLNAGERQGFEAGYTTCYRDLGLHWVGSWQRFAGFAKEYGSIHDTPWEKFTIEEKVTIAMYGGSGSKLDVKELAEFIAKYGPLNLREHYSNLEEGRIE